MSEDSFANSRITDPKGWEMAKPEPLGITITIVESKVYNGLHIRKWENHGLSEGTYRLVVVEDEKG